MKFGIVGNIDKEATGEVTRNLISYLGAKKLAYCVQDDLAFWYNKHGLTPKIDRSTICSESELIDMSAIVIALGGDGTMLAVARKVGPKGKPILGVNLGKLGFLAEVSVDDLYGCIDGIVAGGFTVEERLTAEAIIQGRNKHYYALNEIVLDRGESARMIELETFVNGEYLVTYAADGIIVSTPTGSTAYSLSTGGPIVTPQSNVLTISPISPHTLTARPVIVSADSVIRIVIHSSARPVHITADGQIEDFYDSPAECSIRKGPYTVKLVKVHKRSYFDLLRAKLMWGKDLRVVQDAG